jgi:hypothetical protein
VHGKVASAEGTRHVVRVSLDAMNHIKHGALIISPNGCWGIGGHVSPLSVVICIRIEDS